MIHDVIVSLFGETSYTILYWAFKLFPLWLPPLLGFIFWEVWFRYIRYLFFSTTKYVLLEIKLPPEITKSPQAMEVVLMSLYQTGGEGTFIGRYWDGKTRAWFSLELISEGGNVKFLIWTREALRNLLETQIYSQFPDVEIHQVEDYTKNFELNLEKNDMWGIKFELSQPDPLPIMSYIDYGLDKNPKEELKVDPLTTVLEYFSAIKPGENIWLQIVVRAHKKEKRAGFLSKETDWQGDISKLRQRIISSFKATGLSSPSGTESQLLDALGRANQKYPFDVGIRLIYNAEKSVYNGGTANNMRGLLRPFSFNAVPKFANDDKDEEKNKATYISGFNSFKGTNSTDFDYSWQDFRGARVNRMKREMLDAYKRRMFFYDPYLEKTFVMTTEGLATLYHFPGSVAAAPGLQRIPSKRGQAPTNLPV